jgi:hypothetical protein
VTSAALIAMWLFGGPRDIAVGRPGALRTLADGVPPNTSGELGWDAARADAVPLSAVAVPGASMAG